MRSGILSRGIIAGGAAAAIALVVASLSQPTAARTTDQISTAPMLVQPQRAQRPSRPSSADAAAERQRLMGAVKSWGYQLTGAKIEEAAGAPFDLLVVDATTGLAADRHFQPKEVAALKRKSDGSRRVVVSYLSVGEAEDYRPEYFTAEYMTEDAPDWLMHENKDWKGNRIIQFCTEGWQQTILGDENGRSVYNDIDPSPLYRLIELGFDGVYLDRVDVYQEIGKQCPNADTKMVDFVARLAAHARKRNPNFLVILQNAEDLLKQPKMVAAVDAVAKEGLFNTWTTASGVVSATSTQWSIERLSIAKKAGRPVLVVDYPKNRAGADASVKRINELGFIPYIGPKALDKLWLPGVNF